MVLLGVDERADALRLQRGTGRDELVDRAARMIDVERRVEDVVHQVGDLDIDEGGARAPQRAEGILDHRIDRRCIRIGRIAEGRAHDADGPAPERILVEAGDVVRLPGDQRRRGVGIFGVEAGDDLEQLGRVGDGAAHRPGGILEDDQRRHAGPADQAGRDLEPHQVVERGRQARGAARVLAEADGAEIRGDRTPRAAARPARIALEVVGVLGLADRRAIAEPRGREVGHRRLREDDRAGIAHHPDRRRVLLRQVVARGD